MWIDVDRVARAIGALALVLGGGACVPEEPSPFDGGFRPPPPFDGSFRVTDVPPLDAPPTLPFAPWTTGMLSLPRSVSTSLPGNACGSARGVSAAHSEYGANAMCASGRYLYFTYAQTIDRLALGAVGSYAVESLTGTNPSFLTGLVGCASDHVLFGLDSHRSDASALVDFDDVMQPGAVRWSDQREALSPTPDAYGFRELTASDALTAWVYFSPTNGQNLYVAGPHGEAPHVLEASTMARWLRADGTHLVFAERGDVFLWTVGADAPENLTSDAAIQTFPWISGDHVVWTDARSGLSDAGLALDPDIYGMDLATRTPMRLNQDPPDQPANQYAPVVSGDWAVWVDERNSPPPDPSGEVSPRSELYGFNFTTAREYPILSGELIAADPVVVGDAVFFACHVSSGAASTSTSLFTVPLPAP